MTSLTLQTYEAIRDRNDDHKKDDHCDFCKKKHLLYNKHGLSWQLYIYGHFYFLSKKSRVYDPLRICRKRLDNLEMRCLKFIAEEDKLFPKKPTSKLLQPELAYIFVCLRESYKSRLKINFAPWN